MRTPTKIYADDLQDWPDKANFRGRWACARPESYRGLWLLWRLECAWMVLTGKADVLMWKGGQ